jgi:hypothetical protein
MTVFAESVALPCYGRMGRPRTFDVMNRGNAEEFFDWEGSGQFFFLRSSTPQNAGGRRCVDFR